MSPVRMQSVSTTATTSTAAAASGLQSAARRWPAGPATQTAAAVTSTARFLRCVGDELEFAGPASAATFGAATAASARDGVDDFCPLHPVITTRTTATATLRTGGDYRKRAMRARTSSASS